MKKIGLLVAFLLIFPLVFAIELKVTKQISEEVLVLGVENPAVFNIQIKNSGQTDDFEFFNLLGFSMAPKGTTRIKQGETANIELIIYPRQDFQSRGFYNFNYYIRSASNKGTIPEVAILKIVDLKDAFEIGVKEFDPESEKVKVYIKNKEDFNFKEMSAEFSSVFFKDKEEFTLDSKEEKEFEFKFNYEDFKKINAGFYTLTADIAVGKNKTKIEGIINFKENQNIKTTKESSGWIVNIQTIKKENLGNLNYLTQITAKKNIISRLFTTLSPSPDNSERKGIFVEYIWEREIKPSENIKIEITTNWTLPLVIIGLIVVLVLFIKKYQKTDVVVKKSINFVHSKNGEFALKVSLIVNAKKYLEKVNLVDRLPQLVKVHSQFGGQSPVRVSEEKRRIEWNLEKLEAGEIRTFSYIIYSKVGFLGKFALPTATLIYEREGQLRDAQSNQVFFMAEPHGRDEE